MTVSPNLRLGDKFLLRPTKGDDAKYLEPRQVDIDEWYAMDPQGTKLLGACIAVSDEVWTISEWQRPWMPHMIFGVVSEGNPMPVTWLIGSDIGESNAAWLLQECREFMVGFFTRWPLSECFADCRNHQHHRWIEWLGYELLQALPLGHLQHTFYHFRKEP